MSEPTLGFGTILQVDRGAGMATIVKNFEIGEFGGKASDVDVTTHGSAGGIKEFIRGLVDGGDVKFSGVYVGDSSQTALMSDILGGTVNEANLPYQIVLPNSLGTFGFDGYLKEFMIKPGLDARLECVGSLKVSGQPSFAVSSSAGLTTPFLSFSAGTLIPAAAQNTTEYVLEELTGVSTITITPTAAVGAIAVNGAAVPSGTPSQTIALGAAGSITVVTVQVTEAGKLPKTYTIRVARA